MQSSGVSLHTIIEQVSKEKGIAASVLIETMEQAILTAAKRTFGLTRDLEAHFNADSGNVDLFQYMKVVEVVEDPEREISSEDARRHGLEAELDESLGFQIFYLESDGEKARQQDRDFGDVLRMKQHRQGFGRIAAQTAKQVIIQRVRDAERDIVFNEFKDRRGEIITGVVRRFERGSNIIVDLDGKTEAILPQREQTPRESYRPGDRIVALLKDIDREARGPQVILSRTDVGLLVKLFEKEVPEIYEGIVKIVAAAREPGARSKIAVTSRDSDVDPVGACVGMKGSRVQAVVQELRGEKIDIVPFDRDPARFVCNAIAPAEVGRVIIDEANNTMELVVPDVKLSLAIGRRGQNVRLASQLSGWKLDIISESRFRQIEDQALEQLQMVPGVNEALAKSLYRAGFRTVDEIAEAQDEELVTIEGVSNATKAGALRTSALGAMDTVRRSQIEKIVANPRNVSEREMLLLSSGVTERIADALERAGYRSVNDIVREEDVDRLAIRTGLEATKASEVKSAVAAFAVADLERVRAAVRAAPAPEMDGQA
jgi:N utilization substance protein A